MTDKELATACRECSSAIVPFRYTPIAENGDVQAYFDIDRSLFVFLPTQDPLDWKRNLNRVLDRGIHAGFKLAWDGIEDVVKAMAKGINATVTGYSLGGALAQLAALDIPDVKRVVTFGCPRVFSHDMAEHYNRRRGYCTKRFVFWDDPVTWVPLREYWISLTFAYKHATKPICLPLIWNGPLMKHRHDIRRYELAFAV